jgi:hypothetical protein
MKTMGFEKAA